MNDLEPTLPSQPDKDQPLSMNITIERALIAFAQQHPQEASSVINDLAKTEQEFQHSQQILLNESTVRTEREQMELLKIAVEARASKDNAEAESIRNASIPKGLAETEQIKSQTALNYERAATMKTDRTKHTTAFIARMVIVAASMGAGVWSFLSHQPYQLTLGFVALALAALVDVQGFVKQLKGKNDDKD